MLGLHGASPFTLLLDGTVLVAGGATGSAELYVPAGVSPPPAVAALPSPTPTPVPTAPPPGAWIATGATGTPREEHTAVRLLDGRVLVVGGGDDDQNDRTAELYDPNSGTWSATGSMVKPHARGFAATLLRDGKVLVGEDVEPGTDPAASGILGAEVYDPASGTWTVTGKMVSVVREGIPTLLRDGRVLVVHPGNAERPGSAELYDPNTGTWTATGKMNTRGLGAGAAVLLPDGKVLVPGGGIYPRMLDTAEIYDPDAGSWTVIASMNGARDEITATLLLDGTVLVAGPSSSFPGTSAELYDPASGTWTVTADMGRPDASYRSATLLLDGTVLVTGAQSSPELYKPSTRSWTPFWTMLGPHDAAPATLLLDGRVLVAGGTRCSTDTGECATTRAAELYDPGATSTGSPPPTLAPTPVPTPTPVLPEAGPGGRPWKITVSNNSTQPARLFVAEETEQGLLGQLVGSATPNVVPPGKTVEVTFLVPATGLGGWSIFVNPGPNTRGVVGWTDVPPSGSIHINEEGLSGWMGES